ncbi:MAG: hypothetical protein ABSB34_03095 [Candidatus Limnocylindrales bacterium]
MNELERIREEAREILRRRLLEQARIEEPVRLVAKPTELAADTLLPRLGSIIVEAATTIPRNTTASVKEEVDRCIASTTVEQARRHLHWARFHLLVG